MEDTPNYRIVFPDGRTGFRNGTYESRISRVGTLATALSDYTKLSTLKTEVSDYYTALTDIRKKQQDKEGEVKLASDALEAVRIECGEILFSNLGFLMYKFYKTPEQVVSYFDLSLLRSAKETANGTEPEIKTGTVEAKSSATILQVGFDANSSWHIVNTGSTTLQFYTAMLPTDPVPGSPFELLPSEEADVFASELGADGNLFLMVFNPDETQAGEYSLMESEE